MKLWKLIILQLKSYFRSLALVLWFTLFLLVLWAVLSFTRGHEEAVFVLPIAIIDLDQSEYSQLIIEGVSKKQAISIMPLSQEEALKQVSTGKLEAVYIFKEGLMDDILAGKLQEIIEIVKSPVSLSADLIGELFSAQVMRLSSNVDAANSIVRDYGSVAEDTGLLWQEAWQHTDAYWDPSPLLTIDYESNNQPSSHGPHVQAASHIKNMMTRVLSISLLVFSILISSSQLLTKKHRGIIKRVISTGTPLWIYLVSSILSILIIHALGLLIIYTLTTYI